ncbi:MAG: glycosyltransferase [Alphaproteobacteria bacterium]|nr:glycosyltransferase [Alphaproteobacteria bacterium]
MGKVVILQEHIPHYRIAVWNNLNAELAKVGHQLEVVAGNAPSTAKFVDGMDQLECGVRVKNYWLGNSFYWQPVLSRVMSADLLVVQQELKILVSYAAIISRFLIAKPKRLAVWGHGRNYQELSEGPFRRVVRNWMVRRCDHCFGYTDSSRDALIERGVPPNRITVIYNSINTEAISEARIRSTPQFRRTTRRRLGISEGAFVAVFCSRLHRQKKIPFLIESVLAAKEKLPNLEVLIIGSGEMEADLKKMAVGLDWVHLVGEQYDSDLADYLIASDVFLMPAHLGLSIIDAFSAGLPIIVGDFRNHSPEIDYLENNVNGVMANPVSSDFADAIVELGKNPALVKTMSAEAVKTSTRRDLKSMVANFYSGIDTVLDR